MYEAGILEGLPKLTGLPDGVPDKLALKSALDRIGGEVKITGADAPRLFQKELEKLRKQYEDFFEVIGRLEEENQELEVKLEQLRKQVFEEGQALREQLKGLLKEVTKPNTSERTLFILTKLKLVPK